MKLAAPNGVFFAAIALLALALAPAWLASHGGDLATAAIFAFFSKVCHQRLDRILILFGAPVAVCVRCLGIYAGAAMGSLIQVEQPTALRWFIAMLFANTLDVLSEYGGLHGKDQGVRILLGICLGAGIGLLLSGEVEGPEDHRDHPPVCT